MKCSWTGTIRSSLVALRSQAEHRISWRPCTLACFHRAIRPRNGYNLRNHSWRHFHWSEFYNNSCWPLCHWRNLGGIRTSGHRYTSLSKAQSNSDESSLHESNWHTGCFGSGWRNASVLPCSFWYPKWRYNVGRVSPECRRTGRCSVDM